MDEKRQVQRELFEEFGTAQKRKYPKNIFQQKPKPKVTFSFEHLIFIVIAIIISSLIIFSFGVERGKSVTLRNMRSMAEKAQEPKKQEPFKEDKGLNASASGAEQDILQDEPEEEEVVLNYTVQVASYASQDTAENRADKLKSEGHEAFVLHKGSYYIMCIGKFPDKQGADAEKNKLRKKYSDCLVRKIN